MITPHIRDRFFQRYGRELTREALLEIRDLAAASRDVCPDKWTPGREHVSVLWQGIRLRIVWWRDRRYIVTFLPSVDIGQRLARCAPKRRRR